MALNNCPECGVIISDRAEKCINCACSLQQNSPNSNKGNEGFSLDSMNFGCSLIFYTVLALVIFAFITLFYY